MTSKRFRMLFACTAYTVVAAVAVSCAGSEEEIFDQPDSGSTGGTGTGGTGAKAGTGGFAGTAGKAGSGGTAGTSTGGTAGATGGTAGSSAAGGSSGAGGSCNPAFCPNTGGGTPCCVTKDGPCGVDLGNGCVGSGGTDGGP